MPYLRKRILSGSVLEIIEYYSRRVPKALDPEKIGQRPIRGKNACLTSEQQRKLNNRNAVLELGRLINCNFGPRDLFITTDYRINPLLPNGEQDEKQALKDQQQFIRRLRAVCKKERVTLRYIGVIEKATEEEEKRIHHHIFLPQMSMDAVADCWTLGGLNVRRLDATRDYKALANYLSKDPTLGTSRRKRWTQSKNLRRPEVKARRIDYPGDYIKPPKGFKEMTERVYWSDITGMSRYIRYVKIDGTDIADRVVHGGREGPDPIPYEKPEGDRKRGTHEPGGIPPDAAGTGPPGKQIWRPPDRN